MAKAKKPSGADAFQIYYEKEFPLRWDVLRASLLEQRSPIPFQEGLVKPYFMDEASILVANTLPLRQGDRVLDMCAAPGGKSLVLASRLQGTGSLVCNDRSSERRERLRNVLESSLPDAWKRQVSVTSHDSTKWGIYEKDAYDAILLDAPCSSERHVLSDPHALSLWSPARPKHLALQQFAMLCAALDAVKRGGYVLYSTCAITAMEDEDIIDKLNRKREGRFSIIPTDIPQAEQRKYGSILLPDTSNGKGPLFCCLLRRIS